MGGEQDALKYTFEFEVKYDPGVAEIAFEGTLVELVAKEEHKAILDMWSEKQTFPPKSFERVMNELLDRCHVEALIMARELGIPAPFKLPGVRVEEKQPEKKEASSEKKAKE